MTKFPKMTQFQYLMESGIRAFDIQVIGPLYNFAKLDP